MTVAGWATAMNVAEQQVELTESIDILGKLKQFLQFDDPYEATKQICVLKISS